MGDFQCVILGAASKHPTLSSLLMGMSLLRLVNKPLFSLLNSFVVFTKTQRDDAFLLKVQQSPLNKVFWYLVDWFTSVKQPPQSRS
jgi:hypothetical protein